MSKLSDLIADCKVITREASEELWSLADECREWAKVHGVDQPASEDVHRAMVNEFKRLADTLDAIAARLAEKE